MEMQHELFHSEFKPSVGRSSLLDVIRDSPLGENPHRAVAMGLMFEKTIHDCQERMLVQAKKNIWTDPVIQPNNCGKATSTSTAATQSTTTQTSPEKVRLSKTPKVQLPHPQGPAQPLSTPPTQPPTNPDFFSGFTFPPGQPRTVPNFVSLTQASSKLPQAPPQWTFTFQGNHDRK